MDLKFSHFTNFRVKPRFSLFGKLKAYVVCVLYENTFYSWLSISKMMQIMLELILIAQNDRKNILNSNQGGHKLSLPVL